MAPPSSKVTFSNIMDSNSYAGGGDVDAATGSLIAERERLLGPGYRLFYARPLHLVRGEDCYLYDADGVRYLDAYNNVASVGHCHPRVVDAIARQSATLNTHTRYVHEGIVSYSQRLLATLPSAVDRVMYACTGSEVNDLALRVAEAYTGATGVIVTRDAYHGNTAAVTAISPSIGGAATTGPNVRTVAPPADGAERFTAEVTAAIAELVAAGRGVACLIADSIFSSDGIFPDPSVLAPAVDAVRAAGGVFVADEVQPGFGRTGDAMWGFARHAVTPDVVTVGKPMGNGMPVAAIAGRAEVLDAFAAAVPYFNTFAGNPVSMAAASAVLDVIEDERLQDNAAAVGALLLADLRRIGDTSPRIGDVRGTGLYIGVDVVADDGTPDRDGARRFLNELRDRRVLISVCGHDGNVLKIRPPLVFSPGDVDWFCTEFDAVLSELR